MLPIEHLYHYKNQLKSYSRICRVMFYNGLPNNVYRALSLLGGAH